LKIESKVFSADKIAVVVAAAAAAAVCWRTFKLGLLV